MLDWSFLVAKLEYSWKLNFRIAVAKNSVGSSAAKEEEGSTLFIRQRVEREAVLRGSGIALAYPFRRNTPPAGRLSLVTPNASSSLISGLWSIARWVMFIMFTNRDL